MIAISSQKTRHGYATSAKVCDEWSFGNFDGRHCFTKILYEIFVIFMVNVKNDNYISGLQITNRQVLVGLSSQTCFLLGHNLFLVSQIVTVVHTHNSCDSEPRLYSNPFITTKQLNPDHLGNDKNYKLIVLPLLLFTLRNKFYVEYSWYGKIILHKGAF